MRPVHASARRRCHKRSYRKLPGAGGPGSALLPIGRHVEGASSASSFVRGRSISPWAPTNGSVASFLVAQGRICGTTKLKTIWATLLVASTSGAALAWDAADLNQFRGTLSCLACDLTGANLSNADLRAATLVESDLTGASFYYANLIGADLSDAILDLADIRGANMFYATLDGIRAAGADLSGVNLTGAGLNRADLTDTDLSGANLFAADLKGATLNHTDLGRASLYRADLTGATVQKTSFSTALLCETVMPDGQLDNRDC